jgi:hypothetical protein
MSSKDERSSFFLSSSGLPGLKKGPNAGRQARLEAGAQRTPESVAWTPWLGQTSASLVSRRTDNIALRRTTVKHV